MLIMSCSSDVNSYPVGEDFIENDINIQVIDTFSIKAGTFKLDSLITSSTGRILIGSADDEDFGHLISQSYFQVRNSDFSLDDDAVFDSIGLVLNYDTYYYGDTTRVQTYRVHEVLDYFEPYDDNTSFYNTSAHLSYDPDPLGEVTKQGFRPNSTTDSVYIRLDDDFGKEIFDGIQDNDINTLDDLLQNFNGLTVIPDAVDSNIMGFAFSSDTTIEDNSSLRIYYTLKEDDTDEDNDQVLSFYITSEADQYNRIEYISTEFPELTEQDITLSSEDTNDEIFVQAGTGICARIEMPTIRDLNVFSDESAVLNAELKFFPQIDDLYDKESLEESLLVYIVDSQNRIISQLTDFDGSEALALLSDDEDEFNENTYYTIDMSGFVQTILLSETDLEYAIMIQFVDYQQKTDKMIIKSLGDSFSENIKLSVTYLKY